MTGQGFGQGFENHEQGLKIEHGLQGFSHFTGHGFGGQTSHLTGQGFGGQTSHFTGQGLGHGFENHEQGLKMQQGLQGFSHFTGQGLGGQTFSHFTGHGFGGQGLSHLTGQGLGHGFENHEQGLKIEQGLQGFSHFTGQGLGGQTFSHLTGQGFAQGVQTLQLKQETFFSGHFFSSGQGFSQALQYPPRANEAISTPLNQPACLILMTLLPFLEPLF